VKVSVIILNWNGKRFLEDCLTSLAAQTFLNFEIVLVENGSTDGSAEFVRERYSWVKQLVLDQNLGFSGGNNQGLAVCRGEYIVTLNNDTRVETTFLAELVAAADADPGIGMVAAKMLNFYDTGRIDSVGIRATTAGLGVNRGVGEADRGQYDTPEEVFGACAGAALYRRAMLDEVGFFDAEFFAYYEDTDLAWRARLAGWRCMTAPRAVVYHVHSATSGRMSPFTVYQVQRNKWYTIIKNWPGRLLLEHLTQIICYDLGAIVLAVLRGRLGAALRARLHVLRDLPLLLRKRREIQALRKVTVFDVERFLEPGGSSLQTFKRKMGSGV
jgi:GT2 family glycosyltransferase